MAKEQKRPESLMVNDENVQKQVKQEPAPEITPEPAEPEEPMDFKAKLEAMLKKGPPQ